MREIGGSRHLKNMTGKECPWALKFGISNFQMIQSFFKISKNFDTLSQKLKCGHTCRQSVGGGHPPSNYGGGGQGGSRSRGHHGHVQQPPQGQQQQQLHHQGGQAQVPAKKKSIFDIGDSPPPVQPQPPVSSQQHHHHQEQKPRNHNRSVQGNPQLKMNFYYEKEKQIAARLLKMYSYRPE